LDLGSLVASMGVDMTGLNQAQAGLQNFDRQAESTFSKASGYVSSFGGQLMALVGISLSVAASLAIVKSTIEAIASTNLKSISGAAMMLSRANIEGLDEQKAAYAEYRNYVLSMYSAINKEVQYHFASGQEMQGTFNALVQRGIYASQSEAKSIGVITDAMKLLHGGTIDEGTAMHEIMGLMEGHAGIRFKLAQQLSSIIGPGWKEIVKTHIEEGTLLTWMEDIYKGLGVAQEDIEKQLTSQKTTLSTTLSIIGKGGLGGLYEDIVGFVETINDYLREHKTDILVGIAKGWQVVHDIIEKSILQLNGNVHTSEIRSRIDRIKAGERDLYF